MLFQCFHGAGTGGCGFCDVIRQGIICQGRLIAVKADAARGHSLLRGFRVHNGELRTLVHIKALAGLADCQGMPVQIDGSVLRNAQIRAIIPIRRPGIAGQLKVAAGRKSLPNIAGQRWDGQKLYTIPREVIRVYRHVAVLFGFRFHVRGGLGIRINVVDLGVKPLRVNAAEGHGHGAGWLDLFLSVPQGDVQQVAPLRFGLFFSQNLIANRLTLLVRHIGHRYRDFPCRIGQEGTLAGDGHGDAVFGLRRQGEFLRSLRQVDIAQNSGVVRPVGQQTHRVLRVAFHGGEAGIRDLRHQTRPVGRAVPVPVKEHQVSSRRGVGLCRFKGVRPGRDPAAAVSVRRDVLHPGVMQAEGQEHDVPVAVRLPAPRAIAGVALNRSAVLRDNVVFRTLGIAQLGFGDGKGILPPIPGQRQPREGLLPLLRRLHVRAGVRVTGKTVGVFFLSADQLPVCIPTGFPVGMGVLAAEYRFFLLILRASLAVGVFFPSADQLPGVHRLRHRLKAGVGVLMLQNLGLSACQIAARVKAVGRVTVEDDLRFRADQHRLSIRGQVADQNLLPCIAVIGMTMVAVDSAEQYPGRPIAAVTVVMAFRGFDPAPDFILTAFVVLVALAFLLAAGNHGGLGVAGIRMDMLPADQIAPHRRIAALRVGMSFRQDIAVGSVLVCLNLGKRTPEIPGFVIAAGIMAVNHKIGIPARQISVGIIAVRRVLMNFQRLRAAHGNPFLNRRHLRIAGVRVGVLRDVTLLFQCDRRQNQRIGGTEYHHTGKDGHYPMPEALPFMHLRVFFRIPQNIILHISLHHPSYLNAPKSGRGQTRNTILPTICSSEMQPTAVLRESTEVER